MRLTQSHAMAAAIVALVCATAGQAYDAHRSRLAIEGLRADVERAPAPKPEAQHAICAKDVSHLDHDVDLGVPAPCPDPSDGVCIVVAGKPVPESVAAARCKAGKL